MQLTTIKDSNDGYCYLLIVIDVLSKYVWVEPLRDKTSSRVTGAFKNILERAKGRMPLYLQSDRGGEFTGSAFQTLIKKHGIRFRVARNPDIKASIVERLNRTIRERMWRYFPHRNTKRYIDIVREIIHTYNHTIHSGTKIRPSEVDIHNAYLGRKNLERRALQQTYNKNYRLKRAPGAVIKYFPGDLVRISRTKNTFERGSEKNFSEEIFEIERVSRRQNLYTYILRDLHGEISDGFFYTEEFTLAGKNRIKADPQFKIESILSTKGRGDKKQVLFKWLGYPDKFISWIKVAVLQAL